MIGLTNKKHIIERPHTRIPITPGGTPVGSILSRIRRKSIKGRQPYISLRNKSSELDLSRRYAAKSLLLTGSNDVDLAKTTVDEKGYHYLEKIIRRRPARAQVKRVSKIPMKFGSTDKEFPPLLPVQHVYSSTLPRLLVHFLSFGSRSPPRTLALLLFGSIAGTNLIRRRHTYGRAATFWIRAGPCVAHYKFTQGWMALRRLDRGTRDEIWERLHNAYAPQMYDLIVFLRGLYVKIGQVMSSRADFVPRQYVDLFSNLQDDVPPRPAGEILEILRQSLATNQNLELDEVFSSINENPLGTASIGQVHEAVLRPRFTSSHDGTNVETPSFSVVVKVKNPRAQGQFRDDFKVFKWLTRIALPGWKSVLSELERQVMTEFDYRNEAVSLETARENLKKSKFSKRAVIPRPIKKLSSQNVLVMEKLKGEKLANAVEGELAGVLGGNRTLAREFLKRRQQEIAQGTSSNNHAALNEMIRIGGGHKNIFFHKILRLRRMAKRSRNYLRLLLDIHGHQIFHDGSFNADPHPGNILLLSNGRLGLIDYGQFKTINLDARRALAGIVVELTYGGKEGQQKRDVAKIAEAMRHFGFSSRHNDDEVMAAAAELYFDSDSVGRRLGFATPQVYFEYLNSLDPMVDVPEAAVMVARTSFLFRGLGALLQQDIRTAQCWLPFAKRVLLQ
mmetsp:Transcript_10923/g.24031  ORF Transcript_10923/g.24031 Transcript_10923/m.24031 type:complete len:675 (-) Transcript_10923:113-2137(-)